MKARAKRKAEGLCAANLTCQGLPYPGQFYCDEHRKLARERTTRVRLAKMGSSHTSLKSLLEMQGNCCGLCGLPFGVAGLAPAIDHDHETGRIRSVIHQRCNVALGMFKDDPDKLMVAAMYLRSHKSRTDYVY